MAVEKRNSFFSPILVLVSIGLVASFCLAGINQITAGRIEALENEMKTKALKLVLPDASSFTKLENIEIVNGVADVFEADNGAGIVCQTKCKSQQGGEITMMVGVSSLGQITGMSTIKHNETVGIGDKVLRDEFYQTLYGLSKTEDVQKVDIVSGATKTSKCVKESAQVALEQYDVVYNTTGSSNTSDEMLLVKALSDVTDKENTSLLTVNLVEGVYAFYKVSNDKGYVAYVELNNYKAVAAINNEGTVTKTVYIGAEGDSTANESIKVLAEAQYKSFTNNGSN